MKSKEIGGMACLILTAMIWGFAFVSQVQGMASMTPLFFNATRFTLGALSLLPLLWFRRRGKATAESRTAYGAGERPVLELGDGKVMDLPKWTASPVAVSVICGVVLFSASTVQQYGVLYSGSAGRSGFITALYIVMTPLLAFVVLRRRIHLSVVISVAIAVVGFYLLCVTDGFGSITIADVVLLFTAVLSWVGSFVEGSVDWAGAGHAWFAIVYAGVGSAGIAYTLQVVGQQLVPPTRASVIMSLESFFSVIGGALLLGEVMTMRAYVGCALIFAGTVLAQIPVRVPRLRRCEQSDDAVLGAERRR